MLCFYDAVSEVRARNPVRSMQTVRDATFNASSEALRKKQENNKHTNDERKY
jgi:hypothetical protein